ncbi:MAG TPA: NAD-dependent epimerase/dehydratase family protein [Geminicoccaceae bacterium]|nr:NAD-dependent epimerase/dehydratase family protein [Geminicoccaceae bacterium]
MRLMITGGTGFVGSRLAIRARELGHEVRATGMRNTAAEAANGEQLAHMGIHVLLLPIGELARAPDALKGVDAVIHLAAAQHEANVPDEYFRDVNVRGTEALLEASRGVGVKRFVYGSTIGVYGDREGLIDESTPTLPDNIYGATKLEAERLVLARSADLHVVVVRISEVYGPGDRRLLKLFRAIRRHRFFNVGAGTNLHHPIYIDDLTQGLLLAAAPDSAESGEVFVLPGKEVVTTDAMVAAIAAAVGTQVPRLRLPLWPILGGAVLLEGALRPLGIQPPLHRRRVDFFRKSFSFDGSKAAELLGFAAQVGFAEGTLRAARWYEEIGEL